jgi:hypothetical protein
MKPDRSVKLLFISTSMPTCQYLRPIFPNSKNRNLLCNRGKNLNIRRFICIISVESECHSSSPPGGTCVDKEKSRPSAADCHLFAQKKRKFAKCSARGLRQLIPAAIRLSSEIIESAALLPSAIDRLRYASPKLNKVPPGGTRPEKSDELRPPPECDGRTLTPSDSDRPATRSSSAHKFSIF